MSWKVGRDGTYLFKEGVEKPGTGQGIATGTPGYELDTGKSFIFDGSEWVEKSDLKVDVYLGDLIDVVATEDTLSGVAKESTLNAVKDLVATDNTLASVAKEATLNEVLNSLGSKGEEEDPVREFLKQIELKLEDVKNTVAPTSYVTNEVNGKTAQMVDTQSIESTYVVEIDDEDYSTTPKTLISPSEGNRIIIQDVFMQINDPDVGEVSLDFDNNEPIARLYGAQFARSNFTNITVQGEVDASVELSADVTGNKLFIVINYIEVNAGE